LKVFFAKIDITMIEFLNLALVAIGAQDLISKSRKTNCGRKSDVPRADYCNSFDV
jgi:hypothetical protein